MHQNVIQLLIEELADDGPLRVIAQKHQRRLGLFVTLGIDHAMHQGHQFGPHLRPYRFGHVTDRRHSGLAGRLRQVTRHIAPDVPDAALVLDPGQRLAQKGAETLGAIARHAAQAVPVQPRLASPFKQARPGLPARPPRAATAAP